jgi:hypothetical protein
MYPSHAKIHQWLSIAVKIMDHTLEMKNCQLINHLIKRMNADHGQIGALTVSLLILRGIAG